MSRPTKPERFLVFEEKLRDAILAAQDLELEIIECGEGSQSADFMFFEKMEDGLTEIQYRIHRYLESLPLVHSLARFARRERS